MCNNDLLYICIFSNKFDLKQTIRVLHNNNVLPLCWVSYFVFCYAECRGALSRVCTTAKIMLSWWVLKNRKKYFAVLKPTSLAQLSSLCKWPFTDEEKTFITLPTYFHVTILFSLSLMSWKNKLGCFLTVTKLFSLV